jgi:hypothetical protein
LANGIDLISRQETAERYRHVYSLVNAKGLMADALDASELVPATSRPRRRQTTFASENLRDMVEQVDGNVDVPPWFVRG